MEILVILLGLYPLQVNKEIICQAILGNYKVLFVIILLDNNYKDAAAVMIGGVLEEHLRQLCAKNGVETTIEKHSKTVSLQAARLNEGLAKAGVYGKLNQKNIVALLDLRNNAAHGKYDKYDASQVKLMYSSVLDFITRNPI